MKKLFLTCMLCISLLTGSLSLAHAEEEETVNNIKDADFQINVADITPGGVGLIGDGSGKTIDNILLTVLEKLIVVFGVLAVLIMTVGAGYMIIYHGQDEFLSKGKSIFISGIISLAVALSAGMIVKLFAFLLY